MTIWRSGEDRDRTSHADLRDQCRDTTPRPTPAYTAIMASLIASSTFIIGVVLYLAALNHQATHADHRPGLLRTLVDLADLPDAPAAAVTQGLPGAAPIVHSAVDPHARPVVASVAPVPDALDVMLAALTQPTVSVEHAAGSFALTLFGDLTPPVGTPPTEPGSGGDHPRGGNPVVLGVPGPAAVTAAGILPWPDLYAGRGRDRDDPRRDGRQPTPGIRPG